MEPQPTPKGLPDLAREIAHFKHCAYHTDQANVSIKRQIHFCNVQHQPETRAPNDKAFLAHLANFVDIWRMVFIGEVPGSL